MHDQEQGRSELSTDTQHIGDPERVGDRSQLAGPRAAFDELSRFVLGELSLTEVLQRVAELAKALIPDTREVSVTLLKENQRPETVVFTGSLASQLDERQYRKGFGPCLDAAVSGKTILVSTSDPDAAYPEFARVAQRSGVSHSLSVGLPVQLRTVGAINLYAASDRAFDEQSIELAETFAGYAAVAIANAALHRSTANAAAQMEAAMRSRSTIDQAIGIIMGRNRCSPEEGFSLLVTMSQRRNQRLRDIAQEIVSRTAQD